MRYFITGATGFIGGHLARRLLDEGHTIVALVRDAAKAASLAERGAILAEGDITDKATLRGPMADCDGIFHLAGWYKLGIPDKSPAFPINVEGTRNVLEVMRHLGIPKGVYTSTLVIYSDTHGQMVTENDRYMGAHLSEYSRTKWLAYYQVAEPMIDAGLPLVIVQPGVAYGPGDAGPLSDIWSSYLQGRLPMLPQETAFCWAHVEDIAEAHLLAMEKGRKGETYIVGGPAHTMIEAFALAQEITGLPAPRLHPSPAMMRFLASAARLVQGIIPLPPSYRAESLRMTAGVTFLGSDAKARRELGFDPRPLREGLSQMLAQMMSEADRR